MQRKACFYIVLMDKWARGEGVKENESCLPTGKEGMEYRRRVLRNMRHKPRKSP